MPHSLILRINLYRATGLATLNLFLLLSITTYAQPATHLENGNLIVVSALQHKNYPSVLEPGVLIAHKLKGGEKHSYVILLEKDEYLRVVVNQQGIDITVTVYGPDGKAIAERDRPNGSYGPEAVSMVANVRGKYRIEVGSTESGSVVGSYAIKANAPHEPTPQDLQRINAEQSFARGQKNRGQGSDSIRDAITEYEQSISLWQAVNDRYEEAISFVGLAKSYDSIDEKQNALDAYQKALAIFRGIHDVHGEADALSNLGLTSLNKQKSIDFYNQALVLYRRVQDHEGAARTLSNLGDAFESLGEVSTSLKFYNELLVLSRSIKDRSGEAGALNSVGMVTQNVGEHLKAIGIFNQSLSIYRELNDKVGQAAVFSNMGQSYDSIGQKQKALNVFNSGLSISRSIRDADGESYNLIGIAKIYDDLNEKQKALDFYGRALTSRRTAKDRYGEANVLNNIGVVYGSMSENQKALENLNRALTIRREIEDRLGEAYTLSNIGFIYASQGDRIKALDYYDQSLRIRRSIGDRNGEAITLNNIGKVYFTNGERQKAYEFYNQARKLWADVGDQLYEAKALYNLGLLCESQEDLQQALDYYQNSISKYEDVRTSSSVEEIKVGVSGLSSDVYQHTILLLWKMGKYIDAFNLSERARARAFLDQLGNVRVKVHQNKAALLVRQDQTLRPELVELYKSLRREKSKPVNAQDRGLIGSLDSQLGIKERAYEDLLTRLKLADPKYASLRSINTLTLTDIQKRLGEDTTLLSYFVTPEETLAFIVTKDIFQVVNLPVKESDLNTAINRFRDFDDLNEMYPDSLKQLYRWLINPVKSKLKTRVIAVIPHGTLHYLPFAALTDGQHLVGDDYVIYTLPSASVLPFLKAKPRTVADRALALAQRQAEGLPTLKYAEQEAEDVAAIYGSRAIVGRKATVSALLSRSGKATIVHIAAHGQLDPQAPLFSHIILSPSRNDNGLLEVLKIYDLGLINANLVVLSACETHLGVRSRGDDIVGLSRAFIYAGAPTVMASLWTVDDESTGLLMKSFYKHLKAGMSKAEALQTAQRNVRAKYPNPYYWAGFVLTGDPAGPRSRTSSAH